MSRSILKHCVRLWGKGPTLRNVFIVFLTLSFVTLVCFHINLSERQTHHLDLDFLYQTGPAFERNDTGGAPGAARPQDLSYKERVKRIMERQIFRDNPELDHEHDAVRPPNSLRLPWFMKGGVVRPVPSSRLSQVANIWPNSSKGDRIVEQLMYQPLHYSSNSNSNDTRLKRILLHGGFHDFRDGQHLFTRDYCPVNACEVFNKGSIRADDVDAIIFKDYFSSTVARTTNPQQIWILYLLENPHYTHISRGCASVNWTATYRSDSVIVTPYEKYVLFDPAVKALPLNGRDYARNKTKMVAWFVSNCFTQNRRLDYARELGKYVQVDIYGSCGTLSCPRDQSERCLRMLDADYKFYLAFENANCRDYITEKLYNALRHNVVPIVMGASPSEYRQVAPFRSYIHVEDFNSPRDLADYLKLLDRNSTMYNQYFRWKGTGEFINTFFWCRVCALLHASPPPPGYHYYGDIAAWWYEGGCRRASWPYD